MTDTPPRPILALRLECGCGAMRVRHAPHPAPADWAERLTAAADWAGWTIPPAGHAGPIRCPACTRTARAKETP